MKTSKIIAIAAAIATLVACSKEAETAVDTNHFEKGQKVTLTVKVGEPSTRVSSELNTGSGAIDSIDFKWEAGDKIKVTVNGSSAEFTLSSGAGTSSATFTGTMPAGGETFDVQYPYNAPELASQTYSNTEALPHDKMLFAASGCTTSTFSLLAQYSALQLNLYGSKAVGSIVVTTNEQSPKTYTLDCKGTGSGTEPGKTSEPKPFYIVVPAGSYGFTVSVKDIENIEISSKSTTLPQTFDANKFLKMPPLGYPGTDEPAVTDSVTWAPVNCGYDAKDYPYGKLYQWGRKYGQGYNDDSSYSDGDYPGKSGGIQSLENIAGVLESHPDGIDYNGKVYIGLNSWYGGADEDALWGATKTDYDPCPAGWRVPTNKELFALTSKDKSWITNGGPSSDQSGYLFGPLPNQLFLPAAGYRNFNCVNAGGRGSEGSYWSSSVGSNGVASLYFDGEDTYVDTGNRADGYSVRCVQE